MPPGSKSFLDSLYGFKPHAIQKALALGYKYVIWFDPSVLPECSLFDLFKELSENEMLVIKGDNPLNKMTNDKAFLAFGINKKDTENINHIGGTFYGFNFTTDNALRVFNNWLWAVENGIFGSQDEFMAGHWSDESCMALSMFRCGTEQKTSKILKYKNQKDLPL